MPEMKHIRISPEKGIEIIDADALPALKPLQQSDKCAYRRFSDPRIAIVQPQKALAEPVVAVSPKGEPLHGNVFILGLRHTVDWIEFAGLTDEQVNLVRAELQFNPEAIN
ncbi:MAG: hypothetical protein HC790_13520 [Acaryochloridaceae cyanobacterium CSU_3_4]|nr:hypothetical protein [Acaryochloridaceae cyanobacterium CSU_3_4]